MDHVLVLGWSWGGGRWTLLIQRFAEKTKDSSICDLSHFLTFFHLSVQPFGMLRLRC